MQNLGAPLGLPVWGPALSPGPWEMVLETHRAAGVIQSLDDFRRRQARGGISLSLRGRGFPPMGPGTGTTVPGDPEVHRPSRSRGCGRGGVGGAAGALLQGWPRVPDLRWLPVPGTRRPADAKFLAGLAPGQQFE